MIGKTCKGSTLVEMAYLMPVVMSVWILVIFMLFFYHDKSVVTGAAYEASVVGAELWMESQENKSAKIEKYFVERLDGKLLFFDQIDVKVTIDNENVHVYASASKYRMALAVAVDAAITTPEKTIRRMKILEDMVEGTIE